MTGDIPYRFYIIENYQEPGKPKQSIKVFLTHHVITDGLGIFLSLGLLFTDVYEKDAFIQTGGTMSIGKQILLWIFSPITILIGAFYMHPAHDNNPLRNKPITDKKTAAISDGISVSQLKEISKALGVTLNDLILLAFSMSMKEFLASIGDTKSKTLNFFVPFSMR